MHVLPDIAGRKIKPASIFAIVTTAVLSLAVVSNAFFGQGNAQHSFALAASNSAAVPDGATTRLAVEVGSAATTTIQLKYDPVVEDTQRQLLAAGYYKGLVDGVLGRKTRNAIAEYQKATGLQIDGEPSADLIEHIRYTREVAEASLFTGSVDVGPEVEQRASIRRVQTGLAELAYSPGEISGEMTSQTREAIVAFQHDRKLPETGEISDDLLAELAKTSGQSELITP